MTDKKLAEANGPVNAEAVIDSKNQLSDIRRNKCRVCGARELTEKSVGRGLETVIQCRDCGFKYD